jgi:hypothetical protein
MNGKNFSTPIEKRKVNCNWVIEDRLVEADVRGIVARNDAAGPILDQLGGYAWGRLVLVPAIIDRLRLLPVEAIVRIGECTAALQALRREADGHGDTVHSYSISRNP